MGNILFVVFLTLFTHPNKISEFEKSSIQELNKLRAFHGIQPLIVDHKLSRQCEKYAKKLARSEKFIHDPKLRSDIAENIAMSTDSPSNPIQMWQTSVGHLRNMMNANRKRMLIVCNIIMLMKIT